ncbi:MAG TPA: hypothetical protein VE199_05315 [Nitrososphaera sp.]|jgi:hypothetical protein|nr:hypothetical protein [Nitrososphaera sp.]
MATTKSNLLKEIVGILSKDPSRMYSKEEILNLLAGKKKDDELEQLLAELEVTSSLREESESEIYAKCLGGTVYYRWNRV